MMYLVIFLVIFAAILISTYNDIVKKKNNVKNSWAHIDAQLQKRFDLVPKLVEVVKGFAEQEKDIFENVNATKDNYNEAASNIQKLIVDERLTSELKNLYVVLDRYPASKTNEQFLKLQENLEEIESDITYARQFYNDSVTIYNNKIMSFPGNLIATCFNFEEEKLFDAAKAAEKQRRLNIGTTNKCPVCGAAMVEDSNSCPYCGASY